MIKRKLFFCILGIFCVFTAKAQNISTQATEIKDFSLGGSKITLKVPKNFNESFITNQNNIFISYSNKEQNYLITFSFKSLTKEEQKILNNFDSLYNYVVYPYSDKENLLYGEYDIIYKKDDKNLSEIELTSFLKKPSDNVKDFYAKIHQFVRLNNAYISKIECKAQGPQIVEKLTIATYNKYNNLCSNLITDNKDHLFKIVEVMQNFSK